MIVLCIRILVNPHPGWNILTENSSLNVCLRPEDLWTNRTRSTAISKFKPSPPNSNARGTPGCGIKNHVVWGYSRLQALIRSFDSATAMAFNLGTPINTALLLYILYTVQRILLPSNTLPKTVPNEFKGGYSWMPKSHPPTLLYKTYTPKTLEPFNGEEGKRILLAIDGVVYDVTAGRNFYGPSTYTCSRGPSAGLCHG